MGAYFRTNTSHFPASGKSDRRLLALASKERLVRILERMLDEKEFLSDFGVRSWVALILCSLSRRLTLHCAHQPLPLPS